jgi:hypothetical protein
MRVWGLGFTAETPFWVPWGEGLVLEFGVGDSGFRIWVSGLWLRVEGTGLGVEGSGLNSKDLWFRSDG